MATIKLKHINSFYDRHGNLQHICRPPGFKSKTINGIPGSEPFMQAYHDWLAKAGLAKAEGAGLAKAGTVDAAIAKYYKADVFTKALAPETQRMRRNILERFRAKDGGRGIATLQQRHVIKMLEGMSPHAQKNWLKTLRGLMLFTIAEHMRGDDPTAGVKPLKIGKSLGHKTWDQEQVEQYRARHRLGTVARAAIELLLNIAARRYDAHVIGPQHVIISNKDGVRKLCWRPQKTLRSTGKMLKIRILPSLQAALDALPSNESLAFLVNDHGKPFASAAAFGNKFADWCRQAGLKPVMCEDGKVRSYRAHGLRKASLRAAAHAGCTLHELMALSGHSSPKQLQAYLEEIEQELMADSGMVKVLAAGARK
jgi:integrase/recombinase XerD